MNVRQNLSILFYRKTKKINSNGEIPIYVRITIDGFKDEFSSGIKVLHDQWNNDTKTVTSLTPNFKTINKKIIQIHADLERRFNLIQARMALPHQIFDDLRFKLIAPVMLISMSIPYFATRSLNFPPQDFFYH